MMTRPAVFLDKDGTLIENLPYNMELERVRLLPGVREGLQRFAQMDLAAVIVTNQPGMGAGLITEEEMDLVRQQMAELMADCGLPLLGFYFCPHHFSLGETPCCSCRMPKPLLLQQAAEDLRIDLERSWMIGDILDDVEAGHRAGCRSILISSGNEAVWDLSPIRLPDYMVGTMEEAAVIMEIMELADSRFEKHGRVR